VSTYQLDAKRLLCPMPVIRTQDKVKELVPGDVLEVSCTDPGVKNDIPAWCRINGHEVVEIREAGDEIQVIIRVGEA
jgi:TusA-related sulfurtransferase